MNDQVILFDPSGRPIPSRVGKPSGSGGTGVKISAGIYHEEYLAKLRGPQRVAAFEEMLNDPVVAQNMRSLIYPLLISEVSIVPPEDPTPEEQDLSDLCSANLLRQARGKFGRAFFTETSFFQRQWEIFGACEYGASLFIKERAFVRAAPVGYTVFKRLRYMFPHTVVRWYLDDEDHFEGVRQEWITPTGNAKGHDIRAANLDLRTWGIRGALYEGVPFSRPMWGPFSMKRLGERSEMIDAQRKAAAVPIYRHATTDEPTKEQADAADKALDSIRHGATERAKAQLPGGAEMFFMESGQSYDIAPLLTRKALDIARPAAGMFMELGQTATGSRALGEEQKTLATIFMNTVAEFVAETETNGVGHMKGLIEELRDLNFPQVERLPRLEYGRINPDEGKARLLPLYFDGVASGAIRHTSRDEAETRRKLGYPQFDPDAERLPIAGAPPTSKEGEASTIDPDLIQRAFLEAEIITKDELRGSIGLPPLGPPEGDVLISLEQAQTDPAGAVAPPILSDAGPDLSPGTIRSKFRAYGSSLARPTVDDLLSELEEMDAAPDGAICFARRGGRPMRFERAFVDLSSIDHQLGRLEASYAAAAHQVVGRIIQDLADRVRGEEITPDTAAGVKLRFRHDLERVLRKELAKVHALGVDTVHVELRRQADAFGVELPTKLARPKDDVLIGNISRKDSRRFIDRITTEFLDALDEAEREGLSPDETADLLEIMRSPTGGGPGLGAKFYETASNRSATDLFNRGKVAGAENAAGEIDYWLRSEALDTNTCQPCRNNDGRKMRRPGTRDFERNAPPQKCLGRHRCRGAVIPVLKRGKKPKA